MNFVKQKTTKEITMVLRKLKTILLFGLIFCCLYSAYAQENLNVSSKNSLWRVKSKSNSIYLLGSLHLLRSDNYPLSDIIEKAFEDSQTLVLEVDLKSMNDPETQLMMLAKGIFADGQTLEESIGRKAYELAKTKTEELGIDIVMFKDFKPWLFAITLTTIKLQSLGFEPQYGLDSYFYSKAKQAGKQVVALETPEYQMDLFDKMSTADQESLVSETLLKLDIVEMKMNTILDAWSSGDIKEMEATLLKSTKEYPELYKTLITNRNKAWLAKIESFLSEKGNYMILVGAGHLVDNKGLLELLKNKGYSIEQL